MHFLDPFPLGADDKDDDDKEDDDKDDEDDWRDMDGEGDVVGMVKSDGMDPKDEILESLLCMPSNSV